MKIAVTAAEPSLDAAVDPRLGRCPCFVLVDTDTMAFEAVENPSLAAGGGAAIQAAQLLAERGVEVVLTGNCGPNARQTLAAAQISVIAGCSGLVGDVVAKFKEGRLTAESEAEYFAEPPTETAEQAPETEAEAPPPGAGMGRGRGRGGRGRGQGGGRGQGRGSDRL